jgi:hypothetical protein
MGSLQEELIENLTKIIIEILVNQKNKFTAREYFIASQLLWAFQDYPKRYIPDIRLSIIIKNDDRVCEEFVIRWEQDFLWLGSEGFEKSPYGTDSFENCVLHHQFDEELVINADDIKNWCNDFLEYASDSNNQALIESYNSK